MSDQPPPTPPWEWEKKGDSPIEHILEERYLVSDRDDDIAQRAWSELCTLRTRLAALEHVAKAAEAVCVMGGRATHNEFDGLQAAIDAAKETTC